MDVWYTTAKAIVRAYLTLFVDRIHVLGQREIPPGPKIIIANHTNVTDSFIVPFLVKEKVHFLIQSETFTLPVIGRMLALADQIPVYVGQGQAALDAALERLKLGHAVAIFPEGRLNDGKTFHRAGAGATVLALESGVPVIPLGFYVPDENARPIKSHFFNRLTIGRWQFGGGCFVEIGEPWRISNTVGVRFNYREIRRITENLMARVAELVQQAQGYLGEGERKVSQLLQNLEQTQHEMEIRVREAEEMKREAEGHAAEDLKKAIIEFEAAKQTLDDAWPEGQPHFSPFGARSSIMSL